MNNSKELNYQELVLYKNWLSIPIANIQYG